MLASDGDQRELDTGDRIGGGDDAGVWPRALQIDRDVLAAKRVEELVHARGWPVGATPQIVGRGRGCSRWWPWR